MRLKLLIASLLPLLALQIDQANADMGGQVGVLVMCPAALAATVVPNNAGAPTLGLGAADMQSALQGWPVVSGSAGLVSFSQASVLPNISGHQQLVCAYTFSQQIVGLEIQQPVPTNMTCVVDKTTPSLFVCRNVSSPLSAAFKITLTPTTTP